MVSDSNRAMRSGVEPGTVVTVWKAVGQQVFTVQADATGTVALSLPTGLATGVYVVRVEEKVLRLSVE